MNPKQITSLLKRLAWLPLLMLGGCKMVLLDPKGQVGVDERSLIITATLLMLIVVIPVIVMTLVFAWKYRASNTKATYRPNWSHTHYRGAGVRCGRDGVSPGHPRAAGRLLRRR